VAVAVEAVQAGIARDHGWHIEPDWLVWLPGVVTGFNVAVRAVGQPGDGVFTATPVYPPFLHAPANFGQRLLTAPLVHDGRRWGWDWPATEAALADGARCSCCATPTTRSAACSTATSSPASPSSPSATTSSSAPTRSTAAWCSTRPPRTPIAALDDAVARRTITLMAPSKTWNIPALYCAFAIIPDATLRARYKRAMAGIVPHVNVLGLLGAEVAYRDCDPWRQALLATLRSNAARVAEV
jgi:cystathionine beta-lyase